MPGQMALIGKTGRGGDLGDRLTLTDHHFRLLQPPHQQEAVWTGGKGGTEMPRERKAIKAGDALKVL